MKLKLDKIEIMAVSTIAACGIKTFQSKSPLAQAMMDEQLITLWEKLKPIANFKGPVKKKRSVTVTNSQAFALEIVCSSLQVSPPPQLVKESVINPILKSLLEPKPINHNGN